MDKDLKQIIENAEKRADQIIGSTQPIRDSFAYGRPNSSTESTVSGTLTAFKKIVTGYIPKGYTRPSE